MRFKIKISFPSALKNVIPIIILLAISENNYAQEQATLIKWLKESSLNLETTDPNQEMTGFTNDFFEKKNIVLAGEASHGTSEFAQIKHRLFRYLVEHHDFRYFLVEADFAASLSIDRYVRENIGDPKALITKLRSFHISNEDGLNLIKWMNQYNINRKQNDKIRFFGYDCQRSDEALDLLKSFFKENNYDFYNTIKCYNLKTPPLKFGAETLGMDSIKIIQNELLLNKNLYIEKSFQEQWELMVKLGESLEQSFNINNTERQGYTLREQYTAENVKWLIKKDNVEVNKTFLWAHNGHVGYSEITNRETGKITFTLGRAIKEEFKDRVYSIGLTFNKGEFYANEFQKDWSVEGKVFTVDDSPPSTFTYLLSQTNYPVLFLDFKEIKINELDNYLKSTEVNYRYVDAVFDYLYPFERRFKNHILPEMFDGFIFINNSSAINPIK